MSFHPVTIIGVTFLTIGALAGTVGVREWIGTADFVASSVPVRGVVIAHPEWNATRFEARWTGPDGKVYSQRFRDRSLFVRLEGGQEVLLRVTPAAPGAARRDGWFSLHRDALFATCFGTAFGLVGMAVLWLNRVTRKEHTS